MNILVSACLLGVNCRYDGTGKLCDSLIKLKEIHNLIPVCPEIYGGLGIPRNPNEIVGEKVMCKDGKDVTKEFYNGAIETLKLAKLYDCKLAILKERSPSCGYEKIYDGTFTSNVIDGNGIAADMLASNGIEVIGESKIKKLFM